MRLKAADLPWKEFPRCFAARLRLKSLTSSPMRLGSLLSYRGYLRRRGYDAYGEVSRIAFVSKKTEVNGFRDDLSKRLVAEFGPSDALSTVLALTLGKKDLPSRQLKAVFRETGTSHLLVVSGFHVGLVFAALYGLFSRCIRRFERLLLWMPVNASAGILSLLGTLSYALLVGGGVSLLRASLMLGFFGLALVLDKKACPERVLLFAFVVVILVWPGAFLEPSLELSFSALLGILSSRRIVEKIHRKKVANMEEKGQQLGEIALLKASGQVITGEKIGNSCFPRMPSTLLPKIIAVIGKGMIYSTGAWLFTLPVVLFWFRSVAPVSPFANALYIPLFCPLAICLGGLSVLSEAVKFPGANLLMSFTLRCVDFLEGLLYVLRDSLVGTPMSYFEVERDVAAWAALGALLLVSTSFWLCRGWTERRG